MKKIFYPFILLLSLLWGCDRPAAPGQIAFINGAPLTLKQLQVAYDTMFLSEDNRNAQGEERRDAHGALREEYGTLLAGLIIQELVVQTLNNLHLAVSEEELAAEENLIRADFPGEEFERMLMEESIDLEAWRDSLHRHLAVKKFTGEVLRESITLSAQEVEAYYLKHQNAFQVPDFIHFIQFSGLVREQIVLACEQYRQLPDASSIQSMFPNLTIREINMPMDRLSPEQASGLEGLKTLQASPALEMNGEFFAMVLLNRDKARPMTRTETYALIEGMLLEEKTQAEFDKWLAEELKKASIRVSVHLIPENLRK